MENEIKVYVDSSKVTQDLAELMKRCASNKPTAKDLATLRAKLAELPGLWRIYGDLAKLAQIKMLDEFTGLSTLNESVRHGLGIMRGELTGEDTPPIERLLAEQAVTCWLHMYITQIHYINVRNRPEGVTLELGDYLERRLSASQRRYLRALETLARVRRLLRPHAVQVNIADRQVNLMGETKPATNGK